MKAVFWRGAGIAAWLAFAVQPNLAWGQDVTLTAREGGLSISGSMEGYDGEFYRINSPYGALTIDAAGVICDGPACPDLTAPKARLRVIGLSGAGEVLLPALMERFAQMRGLRYTREQGPGFSAHIYDPISDKPLAEITFDARMPEDARVELGDGQAEFILAAAPEPGLRSNVIAMDAMVAVVAPDNPLPEISSADLARVLAGEVDNWQQIGGPDVPLVLHGLPAESALYRALAERLGRPLKSLEIHESTKDLDQAVAQDPWAIAMTVLSAADAARILPLTDSCGYPMQPTPLAVKSEDYPLSLPLHLVLPQRRLPLFVREFLTFLSTPQAQDVVAKAGWIDRAPETKPLAEDGLRLINAIQGAGEETKLNDLKRLADTMDGADRLSLTFRFQDGASQLDAHSRDNLADLAKLIEIGKFRDKALILAGFTDGAGPAAANLSLSQARADAILAALEAATISVPKTNLPQVMAFGEIMPMACDETNAGRRLNRRVEVWVKPEFKGSPPPEN